MSKVTVFIGLFYFLMSSVPAFGETITLKCKNQSSTMAHELTVICNSGERDFCLLNSRSVNSKRGHNLQLSVVSTHSNFMTFENVQTGVRVVLDIEDVSAEIYYQAQGLVAVCK